MNVLKNLQTAFLAGTPTFNNSIFQKLFDGVNSIYGDFVAISTILAAVSAVIVLIGNFLLPGGDSKEGMKRLKTIFFAYIVINSIMLLLEFAYKLTA